MSGPSTSPYVSQAVVNYNASPPPDDGSKTALNQITWSGIKTKLGDPVNTFGAAINAAAVSMGSKTINTDAGVNNQIAGSLALGWATATIGTDVLTPLYSAVALHTEGHATLDTLQSLSATGIQDGAILVIRQYAATETINIIHSTSTAATATNPNIFMADLANYLLDDARKSLTLMYQATASGWKETTRGPVGASKLLQMVSFATGGYITTTATISYADTVPTDGQGAQVLTLSITPQQVGSALYVDCNIYGDDGTAGGNGVIMLFASATTAIAAAANAAGSAGAEPQMGMLSYATTATGLASKTFKVRVGPQTGTFHFNGSSSLGTRVFGGVIPSQIRIWEVAP